MLCLLLLFLGLHINLAAVSAGDDEFVYNGFLGANLTLDRAATVTADGLLELTSNTRQVKGHALLPSPLHFRNPPNGSVFSFSTTFVFGTVKADVGVGGNGLAFFISRTSDFSNATGNQFLALLNQSQNGNSSNHLFAVELDTIYNPGLQDINENHVGIDINDLVSRNSSPAGYFTDDATGSFKNLSLGDGQAMQVWIDYDSQEMHLNVTLAAVPMAKPRKPLLSEIVDFSSVFLDPMYVGFSASTGAFRTAHYVLGWSFKMNGTTQALDYKQLPSLPRTGSKARSKVLEIVLPIASAALVLVVAGLVVFGVRRRMRYAELLEDWEVEFGPHRFSYKDLFEATKGFTDKELLGRGGFGSVYRGVLPSSKVEVAVKRVSHESRQGMREFIAEVVSIGRLRHRNLVQLLGYCRRKGELLLVYDYMPNGSLDKFLYDQTKPALDWAARFWIIKGVAAGLLYLHEDWDQVVVHRDIKASNVLLDGEMNGRLGDFGLARLYDHGADPQTTHVVGTMGYLAPELGRTGKSTTATDVFAFGNFLLEVACGQRPVDWTADLDRLVLLDWVLEHWRKGSLLAATDPQLGEEYAAEEVTLVLKLGLLCSHPQPKARPSMRLVVQYLEGDLPLPEMSATYFTFRTTGKPRSKSFDEYMTSYPSSSSMRAISRGR